MTNVIGQCAGCGGLLLNGHRCDPQEFELSTDMKKFLAEQEAIKFDAAALLLSSQTIPANDQGFINGYSAAIARLEAEAHNIRQRVSSDSSKGGSNA